MTQVQSALIVAIDAYTDPGLTRLRAPEHDAEALARVLGNPDIGGFDVEVVRNRPAHEVGRAVQRFFSGRGRDDLLLLHFSCHGVKDDSGELYFATTDTSLTLLESSAVSSTFVNKLMDKSRAGRVLLFLDCCYSGAFARGMTHKAAATVDVNERLGGHGRAVITASSALQFSFEEGTLIEGDVSAAPSVFTNAVVRGLTTGDADRDQDGWVTLDELYDYVHDQVTRTTPNQTPGKWMFDVAGSLHVARRGSPVTVPSELPAEIRASMASLVPWERESAAKPLAKLLAGEHPGLALAARLALLRMAVKDDSDEVKLAARTALAAAGIEPPDSSGEPGSPGAAAGGEGSPGGSGGEGVRPGFGEHWRRWRRWVAAVALLLVSAAVAAMVIRDGDDGLPVTLPEDEIVVATGTINKPGDLLAVGTDGEPRVLLDGVTVKWPNPSPDRRWIAYVQVIDAETFVPRVMRPDGEEDGPLLDQDASRLCPSTGRPAWSPDGDLLAVICLDGTLSSRVLVVDRAGRPVWDVQTTRARYNPTWTGDGRVIFPQGDPEGPFTLVAVSESDRQPEPLYPDETWSDLQPDWSEGGTIYVRSSEVDGPGSVWVLRDDADPEQPLVGREDVTSVAWSPDGTSFVFASADPAGGRSLWLKEPDADSERLYSDRQLGPPSWGSR